MPREIIKERRWLPGEKPPTIMTPNVYFFYCRHCGSASTAGMWNVKYCQRDKCQKAKRLNRESNKSSSNKKRKKGKA